MDPLTIWTHVAVGLIASLSTLALRSLAVAFREGRAQGTTTEALRNMAATLGTLQHTVDEMRKDMDGMGKALREADGDLRVVLERVTTRLGMLDRAPGQIRRATDGLT